LKHQADRPAAQGRQLPPRSGVEILAIKPNPPPNCRTLNLLWERSNDRSLLDIREQKDKRKS
jgi:hypothetical protein